MYYYIILCSGYRTVSLSLTWQQIASLSRHACRECLASARLRLAHHDQQCCLLDSTTIAENHWYDWEGASEASGLDSHWTRACVNCSHVPALIDRVRVRVIETPYGGSVRGASSIIHLRHLCQNLCLTTVS